MDAMDYRITDAHMDPLDADVSCYTEKSVRMPDCWVVYDPLVEMPARPAKQTGPVTFGSLNNPAKMNQPLLKLWARVLQAVPDSRLLLLVISPEYRRLITRWLAEEGVVEERIIFVGRMSRSEYLRMYDRIDIALDTLPYNGITTTCDALYMGTPVVTLAGKTAAGRAGLAMLRTIELGELAAQSPDELVEICRGLAQDQQRLESLRAGLRQRMQQSPLMDAPRFARNMEAAYRKMWQAWCSASPVSTMG
ncbi:MAG: hypothetical protein HC898_04260 [Phycisphaerales bacterium]|nr:hypothetical protein [Phycisphaerales bacterium]